MMEMNIYKASLKTIQMGADIGWNQIGYSKERI